MQFKNLHGYVVEQLHDWEKVIIIRHLATFGYPEWAAGDNFFRLLNVLLGLNEDQAKAAIQRADEEHESIKKLRESTNVPACVEEK